MDALSQYKLFMIFFAYGLLIGLIIGLLVLINTFTKNNKYFRFATDLGATLLAGYLFLVITSNYNMGQIRWFLVFAFVLGIYLERISFGKIFAKLYKLLYNVLSKWKLKFANSKLGKRLFK